MSRELLGRVFRRIVVLALTIAVIGVGVATVQVAARWRAEAAPIDVAPVGLDTIAAAAASESDRTSSLAGQIDGVAGQIADLSGALTTANEGISGDSDNALALQKQLAKASAKLQAIQKQLKAAQARLDALNAAAARQAALNAAAARTPARSSATAAPTYHESEGGHDD